jgi:hypothetical protein
MLAAVPREASHTDAAALPESPDQRSISLGGGSVFVGTGMVDPAPGGGIDPGKLPEALDLDGPGAPEQPILVVRRAAHRRSDPVDGNRRRLAAGHDGVHVLGEVLPTISVKTACRIRAGSRSRRTFHPRAA